METLEQKLKKALLEHIDRLRKRAEDPDRVCIRSGIGNRSLNELYQDIQEENEHGIAWMTRMLTLTIDLANRDAK